MGTELKHARPHAYDGCKRSDLGRRGFQEHRPDTRRSHLCLQVFDDRRDWAGERKVSLVPLPPLAEVVKGSGCQAVGLHTVSIAGSARV